MATTIQLHHTMMLEPAAKLVGAGKRELASHRANTRTPCCTTGLSPATGVTPDDTVGVMLLFGSGVLVLPLGGLLITGTFGVLVLFGAGVKVGGGDICTTFPANAVAV